MGAERDLAEARAVLGAEAVTQALASPALTARMVRDNHAAVSEAVATLRSLLPDRTSEAVAYAAALPPLVRVAIAALWCGNDSARRMLREAGLELRGDDDA